MKIELTMKEIGVLLFAIDTAFEAVNSINRINVHNKIDTRPFYKLKEKLERVKGEK